MLSGKSGREREKGGREGGREGGEREPSKSARLSVPVVCSLLQ